MNEERVAVVNMALEGRVSPGEAARLLEALAVLELGEGYAEERVVVEPPCRPPLWRESGEDLIALLQSNRVAPMITTTTRDLLRFLRERDLSSLVWSICPLDVFYMTGFAPFREGTGFGSGGMMLRAKAGLLSHCYVNLVTNWSGKREAELPMTHWILLPGNIPRRPVTEVEGRIAEHDGKKRRVTALPHAEPVEVPSGTFTGCLEVRYETLPPSPEDAPAEMDVCPLKRWSMWLAPGVGPVRVAGEHEDGAPVEGTLSAYGASGEGGYFPLSAGGWWRFDVQTPSYRYRETWRAFTSGQGDSGWLSTAAHCFPDGGEA